MWRMSEMGQTYWKCMTEGCEDDHIYHFKGLCRNCTTYTDGKVTEAVPRVRVLKSGTPYVAPEQTQFYKPTRREAIELSRQHKREKKQRIALRRAKKMLRDEMIPEEHKEALQALIGESIGEAVNPIEEE